nr:MAG TPA: Flagellin, PadR, transcription factor, DNA.8A [Caudoviricetes sp.]
MKLNHDCVRSLLLYLEDDLTINSLIDLSDVELNGFSDDEILYVGIKLAEASFITASIREHRMGDSPSVLVSQITWAGHKFLDTIRDDTVWGHTKGLLSKFTSTSITFVSNIASQVLTNLVTEYLQGKI